MPANIRETTPTMRAKFFLPLLIAATLSHAADFKIGVQTFTVPDGFSVEQVAGPPLAMRPIEASFDEQGRLYVTDSSGSNAPVEEQIKNPTHRVVRLEDTNGDGKFDKSVVFADKLMFPEGALGHDGALYVSAVPIIWKLEDTNGDGRADKRTKWFDGNSGPLLLDFGGNGGNYLQTYAIATANDAPERDPVALLEEMPAVQAARAEELVRRREALCAAETAAARVRLTRTL